MRILLASSVTTGMINESTDGELSGEAGREEEVVRFVNFLLLLSFTDPDLCNEGDLRSKPDLDAVLSPKPAEAGEFTDPTRPRLLEDIAAVCTLCRADSSSVRVRALCRGGGGDAKLVEGLISLLSKPSSKIKPWRLVLDISPGMERGDDFEAVES